MATSGPVDRIVRPATADDLAAVHTVARSFGLLGAWPNRPDFLDREHETGRLAVATVDNRVVAFAGAFRRGDLTHLADLFVLRDFQSHGLGQRLLDIVLPGAAPMVTFASADPRAVALYVRYGMYPRGVLLYLAGTPHLNSPHATVRAVPTEQAAALDGLASGGSRAADLTWYGKLPEVTVYATDAGYAMVRTLPDGVVVGPAGGGTARDCADVVLAAIAAAAQPGQVRITVPGTHPLLPTLIDAGMRIADTDTYLSSHANLIDLDRYIPHPDLG